MAAHESLEIRNATERDEQRILDTLVLAFSSDPIMRWFYPSATDYLENFPKFLKGLGGKAFTHDTAYYTGDFSAAALWVPPQVEIDEDALIALFRDTLSGERQTQAWAVLEQVEEYHPDEPHWYLPAIGVDPMHQRRGLGTQLMTHALRNCDAQGDVAYLESSNPENISLYVRHGFEILGTIHGDMMPPLIPMIREPQTSDEEATNF